MPKGMSAADSLRPRIPAHGTEVLAPSNGNYPPSPKRALFDTVPSRKWRTLSLVMLLCALPHKQALSLPTFARDFLRQNARCVYRPHTSTRMSSPRMIPKD